MFFGFKSSAGAWRVIAVLLFFFIVAPLLQHYDELSSSSGIFVVRIMKVKTLLPQQKHRVEIISVADWRDQSPRIDPSLLRIDLKQNLLVWPNIGNDLTRSPPSPGFV